MRTHRNSLGGAVMQRGGSPWCPVRRGGAGPRRCREPRSSRSPRAPRARASASPQAAPPTTRQVSSEHRRGACRFGGTVTPACPWRGERRMGAGPRGHAPLDWPAGGSRDRGGRSGGGGGSLRWGASGGRRGLSFVPALLGDGTGERGPDGRPRRPAKAEGRASPGCRAGGGPEATATL